MIADQYRRQIQAKRKAHSDAAKKAAALRTKEATKRADAARAGQAAATTKNMSTARMQQRNAQTATIAANKLGADASKLETAAAKAAGDVAALEAKLAQAERSEAQQAARRHAAQLHRDEQAAAVRRYEIENRVASVEARTTEVERTLREPKQEKLRILMLGASPEGDIRVGREQDKIRKAIERAVHRDYVELDVRTAATTDDLLDGLSRTRPHIVHFSGHSGDRVISFEDDVDERHAGVVVTASAFAAACAAADEPPTLVVLNSCKSADQAQALVKRFAPVAIGMKDEIDDSDAIVYGTQLYAAIANGQSVEAAHALAVAGLELAYGDHELPFLAVAPDVDARAVKLVKPPTTP